MGGRAFVGARIAESSTRANLACGPYPNTCITPMVDLGGNSVIGTAFSCDVVVGSATPRDARRCMELCVTSGSVPSTFAALMTDNSSGSNSETATDNDVAIPTSKLCCFNCVIRSPIDARTFGLCSAGVRGAKGSPGMNMRGMRARSGKCCVDNHALYLVKSCRVVHVCGKGKRLVLGAKGADGVRLSSCRGNVCVLSLASELTAGADGFLIGWLVLYFCGGKYICVGCVPFLGFRWEGDCCVDGGSLLLFCLYVFLTYAR